MILAPLFVFGAAAPSASDSYAVIDTVHLIADGGPVGVAVNATTNTVYVTSINIATLSVINGATNAVTATMTVGDTPDRVAVDEVPGVNVG